MPEKEKREERRQKCLVHRNDLKAVFQAIFGNDTMPNSGLKYEFIEFKTAVEGKFNSINMKLNIFISLFLLQFSALMVVIVRGFIK